MDNYNNFARRHIGLNQSDVDGLLAELGYKNIEDLKINISSTNIDDPSSIETGDNVAANILDLKKCFNLTYIPIEILSGSDSIAKMFGDKFKDAKSMCGNSYGSIASYFSDDGESSPANPDSVQTEVALPEDFAAQLIEDLGGGIDVLALLAQLFNLNIFPIDLEEIIKALAGEALDALLGALDIEFGSLSVDDKVLAVVTALEKVLTDAQVREAMLEFLPIQNVEPSLIESPSGDTPQRGFYTIHNGSIYIKLPDMSCLDSAAIPDVDFYEENEDGDFVLNRAFFIEQTLSGVISRRAFAAQPPPTPVVEEFDDVFPEDNDISIRVSGVEGQGIVSYYLSPMGSPVSDPDSDGFVASV